MRVNGKGYVCTSDVKEKTSILAKAVTVIKKGSMCYILNIGLDEVLISCDNEMHKMSFNRFVDHFEPVFE